MKNKTKFMILTIIIVIVSIATVIAIMSMAQKPEEVKKDDVQRIEVPLHENASARMKWEYTIQDKDIVKVEKGRFIDSNPKGEGAGGEYIYNIIPKKAGTTKVTFKKIYEGNNRLEEYEIYYLVIDKNLNIEETHISSTDEIKIGEKCWICPLTEVYINGYDYVKILEDVKLEVPKQQKGTTVNFSANIPYEICVDGVSYKGTYQLGSSENNIIDENSEYKLKVHDLTEEGCIRVSLEKNN